MTHRIDTRNGSPHRDIVQQVTPEVFGRVREIFGHRRVGRGVKRIEDDDFVPDADQLIDNVGTDEPGAAGHEYAHQLGCGSAVIGSRTVKQAPLISLQTVISPR